MHRSILALVFLPVFVVSVQAQAQSQTPPAASPQSTAPIKNPVATSVRTLLPRQQKNILAAISAMPADKFSYKPTPDQISFARLVAHISESNYSSCSRLANIPAPPVNELKESDSKDTLLAAATASFDFCSTVLSNLDDSALGDTLDFGRFQAPRAMAAFFLTSGWADHYGAAAMYLRLNGILPPTAQPKK